MCVARPEPLIDDVPKRILKGLVHRLSLQRSAHCANSFRELHDFLAIIARGCMPERYNLARVERGGHRPRAGATARESRRCSRACGAGELPGTERLATFLRR